MPVQLTKDFMEFLAIRETAKKGRGVFAKKVFQVGDIIEICPVVIAAAEEVEHVDKTALGDYYFEWGEHTGQIAFALGYGSLYNHSYSPNARYIKDFDTHIIVFKCCKGIAIGEEITVNYNNGDPNSNARLWFEVANEG